MTRPPRRLMRLCQAGCGLALAVILLAGPPYALARWTGWPLPGRLPAWPALRAGLMTPLSDQVIIKALACLVWLLWAIFVICAAIEVIAAARGRAAPRLPVIGPFQAVAAALIGATVLTAMHPPRTGSRASAAAYLPAALASRITVTGPAVPGQPAPAGTAQTQNGPRAAAPSGQPIRPVPRVYRVTGGDDLWDIAQRYFGDGDRWEQIFHLNKDKPQPDGRALTDPCLIYPGWVLLLPSPHEPGAAAPGTPPAAPRPRHHAEPPTRTPTPPAPAPSRSRPGHGAHGTPSPHRPGTGPAVSPPAVALPSGALIGTSVAAAVAAAVALAAIQRRRRYRPRTLITASIRPRTAAAHGPGRLAPRRPASHPATQPSRRGRHPRQHRSLR